MADPHPKLMWALYWARRGFHVFPLVANTKTPILAGGWQAATNDGATISYYWSLYPDANIGCCLHLSGCCAIDIDMHGVDGLAAWDALQLVEGAAPETQTHRTQSGGLHLIYKGELPSRAATFAPGVDTRGVGGYIVMPGSTIDGREYEIVRNVVPAPLPAWCVVERQEREAGEPVDVDDEWAIEYARREMQEDWIVNRTPVLGSRNHVVHTRICRCFELGVPQDAALEIITEYVSHGHPPDEALEPWIDRVYNRTPPQQPFGSGLPPSPKGSAVWAGVDLPKRPGRVWLDMDELMASPPLEFWDQHCMIPRYAEGSVGMVYGSGGSFKTQWLFAKMLELAVLPEDRRPRVAYMIGEGSRQGLGARLRAVHRVLGRHANRTWFRATPIAKLFKHEFDDFVKDCREEGWIPDIVIYDTLAAGKAGTMFEEDEKLAAELTPTGMFGHLAAELSAAVIVVHHTGKDRLTLRGASGFEWNVTFLIRLIGNEAYGPTHIDVWLQRMKDGKADFHTYYSLQHDPIEGMPVPVECTEAEWAWFSERDKAKGVTAQAIRGALMNVSAYGIECGTGTVNIAAHVFGGQPSGMDDEEWTKLQNRLAVRIERVASRDFPGMYTIHTDGNMRWFLPVSERPKEEPTKH